ncbi:MULTISPECIES: hypothetical protein [Pseudarthrobacter]|uniref:Uncharacterized protein n=1 Tax=Pseudarthrobacter niigatensis TaxID=369935 RepID=A0AAJ1SRE6_9MICC|nr:MULTISPECIES: hypothetical protein [Pseudarthrobacter]MDQ0145344.1 hypothetical protein [Pseudarthrobacter niigatensis]MDQ0265882.1 hypothetical protein [Pseudarthrobacter niigatensis]QDG62125.1 hypothetical protein NIBR502771_07240 [Pseudarthrobacter sp. NIBRBAC000502771]
MSVHIESPLGFTADFPEHTQVLDDSTAGPNSGQYGLPGGVLVTVIKDDTSVQDAPQANGWAHLMAGYYLEDRGGTLLAEGELDLPGKAAYAVVAGYDDDGGPAKVAATVGVWESNRFIGVVVVWPYLDPEAEPRLDMLKEIVAAINVG